MSTSFVSVIRWSASRLAISSSVVLSVAVSCRAVLEPGCALPAFLEVEGGEVELTAGFSLVFWAAAGAV